MTNEALVSRAVGAPDPAGLLTAVALAALAERMAYATKPTIVFAKDGDELRVYADGTFHAVAPGTIRGGSIVFTLILDDGVFALSEEGIARALLASAATYDVHAGEYRATIGDDSYSVGADQDDSDGNPRRLTRVSDAEAQRLWETARDILIEHLLGARGGTRLMANVTTDPIQAATERLRLEASVSAATDIALVSRELTLRRFCACRHSAYWHRMSSDRQCDSCACVGFDEMEPRAIADAVRRARLEVVV